MRKVEGRISYISELKKLGKLYSIGIKLEQEDPKVWHNAVGFSPKQVQKIVEGLKVGDNVEITEEQRETYWNIVSVKKKEEVQKSLEELPPQKIELKDVEVFEKCLNDAKKLLMKFLGSDPFQVYPQLALMVALEFFKKRYK